jgi:hypothetical protein
MSMLVGDHCGLLTSRLVYQMPCGRSWRIVGSKKANVDHLPEKFYDTLNLLDAVTDREEFVLKSKPMSCIIGFHPISLSASGGKKERMENGKCQKMGKMGGMLMLVADTATWPHLLLFMLLWDQLCSK